MRRRRGHAQRLQTVRRGGNRKMGQSDPDGQHQAGMKPARCGAIFGSPVPRIVPASALATSSQATSPDSPLRVHCGHPAAPPRTAGRGSTTADTQLSQGAPGQQLFLHGFLLPKFPGAHYAARWVFRIIIHSIDFFALFFL
jgi:hypothetical protein